VKRTILLAASLAACLAVPGTAQAGLVKVSSKGHQINSKDAIAVDTGKAYIFYRTTVKTNLMFLREVTPEQRRDYDAKREDAFLHAEAKSEKAVAQWQKDDQYYRTANDGERLTLVRPVKPVAVTRETFAYPPPEMDNFLPVSSGPRVDETGGDYGYLVAVEPGTYALYGAVAIGTNGAAAGTCLCMGSVKFEAPPGKIVDIGRISFPRGESHVDMNLRGPKATPTEAVTPPSAALPVPARLSGLPVVAADLHAAPKMPNYYGIEIDRLPAIPGVLAYQRDRVIDVKTEGAPRHGVGGPVATLDRPEALS
jgi:hypothetical protein